jgi:RND superfamily putative drug exporter
MSRRRAGESPVGAGLAIALWVVALLAGLALLPRLAAVSVTDPALFFPADAPSRAAHAELARLFPDAAARSQLALVVESDGPIASQRAAIAALAARLRALDTRGPVLAVLAPTDDPVLERRLVSRDGAAALVVVQLASGFASEESARVVAEVERVVAEAQQPPLRISISGDATLGRDLDQAIAEGGQRSALATVLLVAAILLAVYRSPVAAGVSLATLGAALAVAFGAVVCAAWLGLPVAYQARAFLVAIVYGVGTDYCLLLFARVQEETTRGSDGAVTRAWRASLPVLAGSAAAVALACALMGLARFGLFRFSGPSLALGVASAAAATLTLAPVLMRLLGRRLFWPRRPEDSPPRGRLWPAVARVVLARPALVLAVVAGALAPLVFQGLRVTPTFENEIELPDGSPSEAGYAALRRHFVLSDVAPLTLVVGLPGSSAAEGGFRGMAGLDALYQLTERLAAAPGVAGVASATRPTGEPGLLARATLGSQLREIGAGLGRAERGAREIAAGLGGARGQLTRGQGELSDREKAVEKEQKESLLGAFAPGRFEEAARDLERMRGDLGRLDSGLGRAAQGADGLAGGLAQGAARLRAIDAAPGSARVLDHLALTPQDLAALPDLQRALDHYVTPTGDASRIEIRLADPPNSPGAVETLRALRSRLPALLDALGLEGAQIHLGGPTPITADLAQLTQQDLRRIGGVVVAGVFVLLVVLLRGLAAPLAVTAYLLASYLAAVGAIALCVRAGVWPGLDWKVPFFLFVLLVAIGADYGVFLLGRAREEARRADFETALSRSLQATGPVVTSCGLVLAGTFAALLLSRIAFLEQVGTGAAVGVLVDTLLVRPFLLPATALLLHRRRWA